MLFSSAKIALVVLLCQTQSGGAMADDKKIVNNRGIITEGQTGNNYIYNLSPQRLQFDEALGKDMLAHLPKGKISVELIGGEADWAVGRQIVSFLQSNGYEIAALTYIGMKLPAPTQKLVWNAERQLLVVAPSAH